MRILRKLSRPVALLVLASLAALVGGCGGEADTGVRLVSTDSAFETVFESPPEGLVVLDVRTPEEFQSERLEGAIMIDYYSAEFTARINELDRDTPYVVYCRSGNRSRSAVNIMEELGFTDVSEVRGGINAWVQDGQPVVAG